MLNEQVRLQQVEARVVLMPAVVAMPIVFLLAQSVAADIPVVVGTLISASAFGSHACFYGDATVLSAKACGVGSMNHALKQLPCTLIAAAVTAAGFYFIVA